MTNSQFTMSKLGTMAPLVGHWSLRFGHSSVRAELVRAEKLCYEGGE